MKIYLSESKLLLIKESKDEVTFYKFFTEVKNFLKKLLDDPIGAKPSSFFKDNDISRSTLLNKLLDRGIIRKKENIDEPNDADGNMKSMHYIQYSIPKKDFEQKLHRLYSYFFENNKKINEAINEKRYSSVATYIFCYAKDGKKCVLAGRRLGSNSGGLYNVPTGLVGDNYENESVYDAAEREVYEEAGLKINKNELKDVGDTPYSNRWGNHLGKNFVLVLDGTTDNYRIGEGDGENDRFVWIPEDKIDFVPWAFDMDKMIKKLIQSI